MSVYIGVNNTAKKVSSLYIGVNNVAKKVKSGYIGINNKARSFLTSGSGVDPTKSSYTEAEINALAAYGEINQIPINSIVTLGNTRDTLRKVHTYRVIGKDHQDLNITNWGSSGTVEAGTAPAIGTVDLLATGAITRRQFHSSEYFGPYHISDIRTWLNDDYYNGFSDVTKTHMKNMIVEYYYESRYINSNYKGKGNCNTNDKVKLLSAKEFNPGNFGRYMAQREGNEYEYFPLLPYDENGTYDAMRRYSSETGTANVTQQWYRSVDTYSTGNSHHNVHEGGSIGYTAYGNEYYAIVPCFRLGA